MSDVKNILFIMCDQLRADYLAFAGHPSIKTPNLDRLAARSVSFTRTYCQAPVCGPSRASFYTGRYVVSHGASYNSIPLPVGTKTIGDYLRPLGLRVAVVGKTHMRPDNEGLERVGLVASAGDGQLIAQAGFEPYVREDGLYPLTGNRVYSPYNSYLRSLGYDSDNPWHDFANSAAGEDGTVQSGWHMRHAHLPARISKEHSETAFTTESAIRFFDECGDKPWCLHLSYIKPHWPYLAPAPYHKLYGQDDVVHANRKDDERQSPNAVYKAFTELEVSKAFAKQDVRRHVIPTYMGLISELDTHIGRLLTELESRGLMSNTLIVFTSDHGDYLGDHWLGEKDLFHEESVRIPLVIYDPSPLAESTRGTTVDTLMEAIDIVPTMVDSLNGKVPSHQLEGQSLLPHLRSQPEPADIRECVFSECDYAYSTVRLKLGLQPSEARGYMVRTQDWKYILFERQGFQLFDLINDPHELNDLSREGVVPAVVQELNNRLFEWLRQRKMRTTVSDADIVADTGRDEEHGFFIGQW